MTPEIHVLECGPYVLVLLWNVLESLEDRATLKEYATWSVIGDFLVRPRFLISASFLRADSMYVTSCLGCDDLHPTPQYRIPPQNSAKSNHRVSCQTFRLSHKKATHPKINLN